MGDTLPESFLSRLDSGLRLSWARRPDGDLALVDFDSSDVEWSTDAIIPSLGPVSRLRGVRIA